MVPQANLHPRVALLHPLFLGALALLVVNDHLWKGEGVVPSILTGKLSDVAGLLVAPLVLALVLRVRTQRGWWLVHVVVAAGFSWLQVSPAAAAWVCRAWASVGVSWAITPDPTDLLALPVMWLSLVRLGGAMKRSPRRNLRRLAEVGAGTIATWACVATSSTEPPPPSESESAGETGDGEPELEYDDVVADVYLHNTLAHAVVVRVRELKAEVVLDCEAVLAEPERLITELVFASATTWTLPPDTNIAVRETEAASRGCYAVWVEAGLLEPVIIAWPSGMPGVRTVSGVGNDGSVGAIDIVPGHAGSLVLEDPWGLAFVPAPVPTATEACAPVDVAAASAWSRPVPVGSYRIVARRDGLDGCVDLELADVGGESMSPLWTVCVPQDAFVFEVEDRITILESFAAGSSVLHVADLEFDAHGGREVFVVHGPDVADILELSGRVVPLDGCEQTVVTGCGSVERAGRVDISSAYGELQLMTGAAPVTLGDAQRSISLWSLGAGIRSVAGLGCAAGPLGPFADLVVLHQPTTNP